LKEFSARPSQRNRANCSLQQRYVSIVVFSGNQRLGISSNIAPAEQVQADFAPQRAFVSQPAGAAVARAEPPLSFTPVGRVAAKLERRSAHAGLSIRHGPDNSYCIHVVSVIGAESESIILYIERAPLTSRASRAPGISENLVGNVAADFYLAEWSRVG
jgi:hypothetical protein